MVVNIPDHYSSSAWISEYHQASAQQIWWTNWLIFLSRIYDWYYIIWKNDRYQRYQQLVSLERPVDCFLLSPFSNGFPLRRGVARLKGTARSYDLQMLLRQVRLMMRWFFWGQRWDIVSYWDLKFKKNIKWNNPFHLRAFKNSDPNLKVTGHPGHPARVCISQVLALTESVDKLKRSVDRRSRANQENTPWKHACCVKRALVPCGCDLPLLCGIPCIQMYPIIWRGYHGSLQSSFGNTTNQPAFQCSRYWGLSQCIMGTTNQPAFQGTTGF